MHQRKGIVGRTTTDKTPSLILLQALQVDQFVVAALFLEELVMGPAFNDPALVENVDDVGLLDRAETVCDGDSGASLSSSVQSFLHHLLRLGVESGSGFVEKQDPGIAEKSTGNGHTLLLPTGKHGSLAAHDSGESLTDGMSVNKSRKRESKHNTEKLTGVT